MLLEMLITTPTMSRFNLLQNIRDINERLLVSGNIDKDKYFEYEKQLDRIKQLFIINLN